MSPSTLEKVILVGHCGSDSGALEWFIDEALHLPVETANSVASLQAKMTPQSLLLINRVMEGSFPTDSGLELIAALMKMQGPARMMLISNYADAQAAAVKLGALQGFGKSQIGDEELAQRLRSLT